MQNLKYSKLTSSVVYKIKLSRRCKCRSRLDRSAGTAHPPRVIYRQSINFGVFVCAAGKSGFRIANAKIYSRDRERRLRRRIPKARDLLLFILRFVPVKSASTWTSPSTSPSFHSNIIKRSCPTQKVH